MDEWVLGKAANQETHPHWVDVRVGRLALRHLYGGDAQGPDVRHAIVPDLLDHLWSHPEGSADHRVALGHGVLHREKKAHASWGKFPERGTGRMRT